MLKDVKPIYLTIDPTKHSSFEFIIYNNNTFDDIDHFFKISKYRRKDVSISLTQTYNSVLEHLTITIFITKQNN